MIVQFRPFFLCNAVTELFSIAKARLRIRTVSPLFARIVSLPCLYLLILTCKYSIISILLKSLEIKRREYCEDKYLFSVLTQFGVLFICL